VTTLKLSASAANFQRKPELEEAEKASRFYRDAFFVRTYCEFLVLDREAEFFLADHT